MSDTAMVRLRDGAELWATVSGTGPPVACLHGGPGLWDYLASLAGLLDDTFTVIRFDQRGCGRSTADGGPFTIAQAVDDLDQVRPWRSGRRARRARSSTWSPTGSCGATV